MKYEYSNEVNQENTKSTACLCVARRQAFFGIKKILFILFSFCLINSFSQEKEVSGKITASGTAALKIAIAVCKRDEPLAAQATEIESIISFDLQFSGMFDVIDRKLTSSLPSPGDNIEFEEWKAFGAEYLVTLNLYSAEGRLILEGRLYDLKTKELVTGKRIKTLPTELRLLAHSFSSIILEFLFGSGKAPTSKILFTSAVGKEKDIYICDYDGKNVLRLTALGLLNITPDVNRTGDLIAFTSVMKDQQELFLLDRSGKRHKIYGSNEGLNSSPAFSPDGKTIAFCSSRSGNPEIYLIPVAGGQLTQLTHSHAIDTAPAWSPNGQEIAFTSDRGGSPQIYIMDRDGSNVRRLSHDVSRCDQPAWSSKGDKIAFSAFRGKHFDIALIDIISGKLTFLTEGEGDSERATWSPDGNYIAFASDRSGSFQIYIMRADGAGVIRITSLPTCYSPRWFE